MAGKSWKSNHEPPPSKWNRKKEGKGVGRKGTAWAMNCHNTKTPENTSCTFATLRSMSMWDCNTCAYVSTLLTIRETQALFVINSVKLHLTALKTLSKYSKLNCR